MDFRWNVPKAKKVFLIGGGIGIPPMVELSRRSFRVKRQ